MVQRGATAQAGEPPFSGLSSVVMMVAVIGIAVCVLAISFLANNIRREIDALAAANSDTTQWSLAQTEVELLALQFAVQAAAVSAAPDLDEVRRRYDILYSRVRLIEQSQQFTVLRASDEARGSLALLGSFLDRHTPTIDGPDAGLIAKLAQIDIDLVPVRATVREFSLLGVRFFAEQSDSKRKSVAVLLSRIGYLTFSLVLTLLGVICVLMVMFRRSMQSEREAAEARNRLQDVIATSLDGILAADIHGKVIEYNGAAERIFGHAQDDAIGQNMAELVIPGDLGQSHSAGMERYLETGEQQEVGRGLIRLEARRKDGSHFPVELSLSSAMSGGSQIFVSFVRDISDRVAAEQELIAARDHAVMGERAKAELLAVMSHEMRTPLNGIMGTIELLQGTTLSETQSRYVSAMETSASLLLHHVNGVLSMSRADAGRLNLKNDDVDPRALLVELVESQRQSIEAHGNRIVCDTSAAPRHVWLDALRLRQVILNLVGNANKFTRNGDIRVECDTAADGLQVEFRVTDTGIGIAPEDQERIFEEFRTLDSSYRRSAEGTGLGLAISRRLVHAMGGEIGVESELGEGSLFWFRLPTGAPDASNLIDLVRSGTSPTDLPAVATSPGPQRILLVEDNQINRLVAREMLTNAGHTVFEAPNGREGVRMAGLQSYDVILMDISMPELDGVTASLLIRDSGGPNSATPIIALTAHALPQDTDRFAAAGITDTLIKPLTKDALSRALAAVALPPRMSEVVVHLSEQLDRETTERLLGTFIKEVELLLDRMKAPTWETEPLKARADAVHKISGSAAIFAADALRECLTTLEHAYRSGSTAAAQPMLRQIGGIWSRTLADLRTCTALLEKH